jgi:hypothetical protein
MVVIRMPRLTELAVPTDRAGDFIGEARNTLSFYLWFSCNGDPPLDYKREGHPLRKDTSTDLDHTTSSTHKLVTPLTLTST